MKKIIKNAVKILLMLAILTGVSVLLSKVANGSIGLYGGQPIEGYNGVLGTYVPQPMAGGRLCLLYGLASSY